MQAVEDGWQAFCRAPWPFVLFTLLTGALRLPFEGLGRLGDAADSFDSRLAALGIPAFIVSVLGQVLVTLWGTIGLIRGAWTALEGGRPTWPTFSRWDGSAAARLFLRLLLCGVVLLPILLVGLAYATGWVFFGRTWQYAIPAIASFAVLIYLSVGQTFLPWVSLLEGRSPVGTLLRSRAVVDPQWWMVALLGGVLFAILLIGALLCGVGLLAAAPLVLCVATAAYRQLFGSNDHTGLLS